MRNLGLRRLVRIGLSYVRIRLFPIREERSLEDFYINRFGRELYETFFAITHRSYGASNAVQLARNGAINVSKVFP